MKAKHLRRRVSNKLRRSTGVTTRVVLYLISNALIFAIGVIGVVIGTPIAVAIGTSLVATGVAGGTLFIYVLLTEDLTHRYELISEFGVRDLFKARSVSIRDVYESRLADATEHIDLLGFGQKSFREDFGQEFEKWANRGVKIRILLLDPEFPDRKSAIADLRDVEENHAKGDIRRDVESFLRETKELRANNGNFNVRLYRCLPVLNILRIDEELFWGPYLYGKPSRSAPTVLVGRGPLFDVMLGHFNAIWEGDEASVDPER
jgi:hypothetical protein